VILTALALDDFREIAAGPPILIAIILPLSLSFLSQRSTPDTPLNLFDLAERAFQQNLSSSAGSCQLVEGEGPKGRRCGERVLQTAAVRDQSKILQLSAATCRILNLHNVRFFRAVEVRIWGVGGFAIICGHELDFLLQTPITRRRSQQGHLPK
jgi:hypothetical protein